MLDPNVFDPTAAERAAGWYARRWAEINHDPYPDDMPFTQKQVMDLLFGAGVSEHLAADTDA